jgi:hypothetical protein
MKYKSNHDLLKENMKFNNNSDNKMFELNVLNVINPPNLLNDLYLKKKIFH